MKPRHTEMDPSVAGSPTPAGSPGREATPVVEPTASESVSPASPASSPDPGVSDEVVRIEREIEALKAFLARYPAAAPEKVTEGQPQVDSSGGKPGDSSDGAAVSAERAPGFLGLLALDERPRLLGTRRRWIIAGVTLAAIVAVAYPRLPFYSVGEGARTGMLSVATNPSGIAVLIDGTPRDVTPLTVDLAPGDHVVELVTGSERRRIPVTITAGGQVSHFLELAPLAVELTETPVSRPVPAVATAGSSDSNAAGWISVEAPSDVQIREKGRLLGSSSIERIMLPVGRHELEFVSEALGYRAVQTVEVIAAEVVRVKPPWPQGSVALNAIPWAEVWIGGQSVGETPIGNLALPIGVHEIVFRHPELGERRAFITVVVGKPTALGVNLGAK